MIDGTLIQTLRKAAHMTQEALATRCHCATNTIGRIERGQLQPGKTLVARIAETLETDPASLASGAPNVPATMPTTQLRNVLHFLVERLSPEEVAEFGPVVDAWVGRSRRNAPPEAQLPAAFDIIDVEQLPHPWLGRYLPVIGRLAAGHGVDTGEAESYPAGLAYRYLRFEAAPPSAFALLVEGQSMAPQFAHGDLVIVDGAQPVDSGICAVIVDDGCGQRVARLKRLVLDGDKARLESLNPAHGPVTVSAAATEAYAIWRHLSLSRPQDVGSPGYRW